MCIRDRYNISDTVFCLKFKAIPVQTDFVRSKGSLPDFSSVIKCAAPEKAEVFPVVIVVILYCQISSLSVETVSYTHLDVYKRQVCAECHFTKNVITDSVCAVSLAEYKRVYNIAE